MSIYQNVSISKNQNVKISKCQFLKLIKFSKKISIPTAMLQDFALNLLSSSTQN